MVKLIILVIAAVVYIGFLQWSQQAAQQALGQVEKLYTHAGAEAAAISVANR